MPAAEILLDTPGTPERDHEKTYMAADGQILQSSMVKSGSPSKRKITGSTSQVRFSLPPPDSDYSFDDNDDLDIVQGFDDTDDFEKRSIFNLGSRELEAPIRGRSTSRSDAELSIGDSMRQLVSTSPERNRLFIRGDSELNSQQLPIPVELRLPPLLSPDNKNKKRPTSLIYNGVDYEPFELELAQADQYSRPKSLNLNKSLPTPVLPKASKQQIEESVLPLQPQSSPPRQTKTSQPQQSPSRQIEIPDLNKPFLRSPVKLKSSEMDNEEEIQNPSPAAKKQNNQLNKAFAFPQISSSQPQLQQHELSSDSIEKDLPQLPQKPRKNSPSKGLEIFTHDGPLNSPHQQNSSSYGRFAISQPQSQETYNYHYPHQQTGYVPPVSKRGHYHRRSRSQIIDFPVDKLDELPTKKQVDYEVAKSVQPERELTEHVEPELIDDEEEEETTRPIQESTPESEYSSYDENKVVLTPPQPDRFEAQNEDSINDSIQSSVDIENNDVESIDSALSEEDDPNQLLDLGRMIISSRSQVDLPSTVHTNSARNASATSSEPSITEPLRIKTKQPAQQSTSQIQVPKRIQPLGSQHQPQIVQLSDNFMPEHIRQISQSRILVNREKSRQVQQDSPNPSHSSYESKFSEPFSATSSSAQTIETSESIHRAGSIMVDLTNDNYDITIKKDDRNSTVDQYRSTFDEIDGKYRETIVLDDDEEQNVPPLTIRHKRSKSALGNLEFGGSNRAFSNFSFETVASEVQLHYSSNGKEKQLVGNRYPLKNLPRTYTEQNKSVVELCDDTMKTTRQVLDDLKRQRTILMKKHAEAMKSKKNDEKRLSNVRELQANLMRKTRQIKNLNGNSRPKSYVYGEDPTRILQQRQQSDSENYFDYQNNQSYNFETFMRSKSSTALI